MHEHIVAYGIGNEYRNYLKSNLNKDLRFDYVADKKLNNGDLVNGISAIGLEELRLLDNTLIVVFPRALEIYNEVKEKFSNQELNIEVIHSDEFHNNTLMKRGRELVYSISQECDDNTYCFVIRYHIGDTVNLFPCISAFKLLHNHPELFDLSELSWWYLDKKVKKIVAITNKRLVGLCDLCADIDDKMVYSEYELEAINYFLHSDGHFNNIYPDEQVAFWQKNPVFVGNMNWYPYRLYDLPFNNDLVLEYTDTYKLSISDELKCAVKRFEKSNNIDIDNTLILCPYANSTSMLDERLWDRIIEIAKDKGYRVFTNTGPKEDALQGTEVLRISVNELLAMASDGVHIFGVQSGVIDAIRRVDLQQNRVFVIWRMIEPNEKLYAYDMGVLSTNGNAFVGTVKKITYCTFDNEIYDDCIRERVLDLAKEILMAD